jgi:hypothetical protein
MIIVQYFVILYMMTAMFISICHAHVKLDISDSDVVACNVIN